MSHEVATFSGSEEPECRRDQRTDVVKRVRACGAEERLQFGKGEFDGIEVGTVRRKKSDLSAGGFEGRTNLGLFVDGKVIEHDHIPRLQRRYQHLLDVGEKGRIVDRSVEHGWCAKAGDPERRHDCVRFPMATWRVIPKACADRTAAVTPQQVRRHAAFIQKDVLPHVPQRLPGLPLSARRCDVRPTLFVGVYRFF